MCILKGERSLGKEGVKHAEGGQALTRGHPARGDQ